MGLIETLAPVAGNTQAIALVNVARKTYNPAVIAKILKEFTGEGKLPCVTTEKCHTWTLNKYQAAKLKIKLAECIEAELGAYYQELRTAFKASIVPSEHHPESAPEYQPAPPAIPPPVVAPTPVVVPVSVVVAPKVEPAPTVELVVVPTFEEDQAARFSMIELSEKPEPVKAFVKPPVVVNKPIIVEEIPEVELDDQEARFAIIELSETPEPVKAYVKPEPVKVAAVAVPTVVEPIDDQTLRFSLLEMV